MIHARRLSLATMAVLTSLALGLAACGDGNLYSSSSSDDGEQARLEEGLAALDAQQWDEAVQVFQGMESTPRVRRYLASAYAGQAGFDVLTLVADFADDNGSADADNVFDTVTRMLDEEGDGFIAGGDLQTKLELIEQALGALTPALAAPRAAARTNGADVTGLTDEEVFQIGLYAAMHAVLGVVEQLQEPTSGDYLLTVAALRAHADVVAAVELPTRLNRDLDWVERAKEVLVAGFSSDSMDVSGNDIAEEFDEFLYDLGYYRVGDAMVPEDRDVTVDELRGYLLAL